VGHRLAGWIVTIWLGGWLAGWLAAGWMVIKVRLRGPWSTQPVS